MGFVRAAAPARHHAHRAPLPAPAQPRRAGRKGAAGGERLRGRRRALLRVQQRAGPRASSGRAANGPRCARSSWRGRVVDMEAILQRGGYPAVPALATGTTWDLVGEICGLGRRDLFARAGLAGRPQLQPQPPARLSVIRATSRARPAPPSSTAALRASSGARMPWEGWSLERINEERRTHPNPGATVFEDPSCWRGIRALRPAHPRPDRPLPAHPRDRGRLYRRRAARPALPRDDAPTPRRRPGGLPCMMGTSPASITHPTTISAPPSGCSATTPWEAGSPSWKAGRVRQPLDPQQTARRGRAQGGAEHQARGAAGSRA